MLFRSVALVCFVLLKCECMNIFQFSESVPQNSRLISFFSSAGISFDAEPITSLAYHDGKFFFISNKETFKGLLVYSDEKSRTSGKQILLLGDLKKLGTVCAHAPQRELDRKLTNLAEAKEKLDNLTDRLIDVTETLQSDPKFSSLVLLMEFNRSINSLLTSLKEHKAYLLDQRKQFQEFKTDLNGVSVANIRTNTRTYGWILTEFLRNFENLDSVKEAVYSLTSKQN